MESLRSPLGPQRRTCLQAGQPQCHGLPLTAISNGMDSSSPNGINACQHLRPRILAQSMLKPKSSLFANEKESIYGHLQRMHINYNNDPFWPFILISKPFSDSTNREILPLGSRLFTQLSRQRSLRSVIQSFL